MKNNLISLLAIFAFFIFSNCSSHSVLPDKDDLKVSRTQPDDNCTPLGKVTGNSLSTKATPEIVLENMKEDAVNKGANYLVVEQYSATGTSVTGLAFKCP